MKRNFIYVLSILSFGFLTVSKAESYRAISPDGRLEIIFSLSAVDSQLHYQVNFDKKEAVKASSIGITCNGVTWDKNLKISAVREESFNSFWTPPYGEREKIRDIYNKLTLTVSKIPETTIMCELVVRVYNEGVAFRYRFPELERGGPYLHISGESTQFTFMPDTKAWFTPRAQTLHRLMALKDWPGESERPLTLELQNGLYVSLTEAQVVDYVRTKFELSQDKPNTICCRMYGEVDNIAPFESPWRVIMVAHSAGELLQNNDLILNLNPPCEIENVMWIKPGKIMRETSLSTEGGINLVDFAVAHHLDYIHFDAGWYGNPNLDASDATQENVDPKRSPGGLDLKRVINYANSKGVGVWLYVDQRALFSQLDTILPLYKSWGVAGIKFGFVHVGSHRWTTWLHDAVKKCASHNIMVDIHDEYRPTGFSRTYPNLLTQEGIHGNEEMPDATNNTILPFTRFIAGAADYTFCYYARQEFGRNGRYIRNSPAHQLALPVIYYSPLQFLYWYDTPRSYQGEPELEFWDQLPVTWSDSKVLTGEIGKYIAVARRQGQNWFVGIITNTEERSIILPLNFLKENEKFEATIYFDDPTMNTRTHVGIQKKLVNHNSELTINLGPSGGQAILITPVDNK